MENENNYSGKVHKIGTGGKPLKILTSPILVE
jgi:hypothetical protein